MKAEQKSKQNAGKWQVAPSMGASDVADAEIGGLYVITCSNYGRLELVTLESSFLSSTIVIWKWIVQPRSLHHYCIPSRISVVECDASSTPPHWCMSATEKERETHAVSIKTPKIALSSAERQRRWEEDKRGGKHRKYHTQCSQRIDLYNEALWILMRSKDVLV